MRICIECKDIIIEESLKLFLKEYLVMKKDCDFLISDVKIHTQKPLFIISQNSPFLSIPFSKEALLQALKEFDDAIKLAAQNLLLEQKRILEEKINLISNEFRKEYENKIDEAIKELKTRLMESLNEK